MMSDSKISNSVAKLNIEHDVSLKEMNTLGVEVYADTFVDIHDPDQLKRLFDDGFFAEKSPIILGGGSNLLFKKDPDQPVLKVSILGNELEEAGQDTVTLKAGAGENWHELVTYAVNKQLGGIENLALIPGTTGAAPIQNIGAYGVELKDVFESLTAFDVSTGEFKIFEAADCNFGYRDSVFKQELKGQVIVCDVTLRLKRENSHRVNLTYRGLSSELESRGVENPSIKDIYDAVVDIRNSKLPDPKDIGNAGSFFKNPVVSKDVLEALKADYPTMPAYELDTDEYKIPAAWLIETAGWKGKQVGNVGTYKNQALVIVNHGGATGQEIYEHAKTIQKSVRDTFDIDLTPEVNIVGS